MDNLFGFYPATILSYNGDSKTAQVSIEPYTSGSEDGIQAKIAYPVGFTDNDLELSIVPNTEAWVFFEKGQFKNPVIGFFRTKQAGSTTGILRIRQKTIELIADEIKFIANTTTTGDATTQGDSTTEGNISTQGTVTSDGDMIAAGVSATGHDHGGVQSGSSNTKKPNP